MIPILFDVITRIFCISIALNLSACFLPTVERWVPSPANWQMDTPLTNNVKSLPSGGVFLAYNDRLIRVDSLGNKTWEQQIATAADEKISLQSFTTDVNENIFATWQIDLSQSQSSDQADWLIAKYDPLGNKLWDARYASPNLGYDLPIHIQWVESLGVLYVVGFSNWRSTTCTTCFFDTADLRIVSYDASGNTNWEYSEPAVHIESLREFQVKVDNLGTLYYATVVGSQVTTDQYDTIVWTLNSSGKLLNKETIVNARLRSLQTSTNNELYITYKRQGVSNTTFLSKYAQNTRAWEIQIEYAFSFQVRDFLMHVAVSPMDYVFVARSNWLRVYDPSGILVTSRSFPKPPNGDLLEFNSLYIPYRPDTFFISRSIFFDANNQPIVVYERAYEKCLGIEFPSCNYVYKGAGLYHLSDPIVITELNILSTLILPSGRVHKGNTNNFYVVGNDFKDSGGLLQYSLP